MNDDFTEVYEMYAEFVASQFGLISHGRSPAPAYICIPYSESEGEATDKPLDVAVYWDFDEIDKYAKDNILTRINLRDEWFVMFDYDPKYYINKMLPLVESLRAFADEVEQLHSKTLAEI